MILEDLKLLKHIVIQMIKWPRNNNTASQKAVIGWYLLPASKVGGRFQPRLRRLFSRCHDCCPERRWFTLFHRAHVMRRAAGLGSCVTTAQWCVRASDGLSCTRDGWPTSTRAFAPLTVSATSSLPSSILESTLPRSLFYHFFPLVVIKILRTSKLVFQFALGKALSSLSFCLFDLNYKVLLTYNLVHMLNDLVKVKIRVWDLTLKQTNNNSSYCSLNKSLCFLPTRVSRNEGWHHNITFIYVGAGLLVDCSHHLAIWNRKPITERFSLGHKGNVMKSAQSPEWWALCSLMFAANEINQKQYYSRMSGVGIKPSKCSKKVRMTKT